MSGSMCWDTHSVDNQAPPRGEANRLAGDPVLMEALGAWGSDPALLAYGAWTGSAEAAHLADEAHRDEPRLVTHDRFGYRVDRVDYNDAYHRLMRRATQAGVHALPWWPGQEAAHLRRAVLFYLHAQLEPGTCCPLTMTFAGRAVLARTAANVDDWLTGIIAADYDGRDVPAAGKPAATLGMAMTEKQGGSDVRANTTRAVADGEAFRLTGHKWFCSAPMSDAFLMLAYSDDGLDCFLVPRWCPDGTRNAIRLQRLKTKQGNRSNASAEIELCNTWGLRLSAPGRGVATIIDMVALTRYDCVLGSAGLLRRAVVEAVHHARHRQAFGRPLVEQPLMANVLADLALESEAAVRIGLRLAQALDAGEHELIRLGTALGKFWVCKRTSMAIAEAQECLGGNGYVEESVLPRLYREAPVNSIWEGSGNIQCLDVLRTLERSPASVGAFRQELEAARGGHPALDDALDDLWRQPAPSAATARRYAARLARLWQAALMVRHAPAAVADAFCASRLVADQGVFGSLPAGIDCDALVRRVVD